jgi:hypothetical protein
MGGGSWARRLVAAVAIGGLLGGCAAGANPSPSAAPSGSAALRSDPFAGLTYRLDLPADWIVLGSSSYDVTLDSRPDVASWLTQLNLVGPNAFRAYEPLPGAAGLRLAVNPASVSGESWIVDGGVVSAFPGVTGEPVGDMVPVGQAAKASRFRWKQSIDWGSGSSSARTCVWYVVMGEFAPVNVVLSYPAETDRLADVEALMATFEALGNPVVSLPPGVTPAPTPTPFDKWASPEGSLAPTPASHGDPALEALLPDSVDGRVLTKTSSTGAQTGMTDADPILTAFGKHPSDLADATAFATPAADQPMLIIAVDRLRGVPADQLLVAILKRMPDAKVSRTSLGGRQVTYVMYGAWPVWYYTTGELLYEVAGSEENAAKVLAGLP